MSENERKREFFDEGFTGEAKADALTMKGKSESGELLPLYSLFNMRESWEAARYERYRDFAHFIHVRGVNNPKGYIGPYDKEDKRYTMADLRSIWNASAAHYYTKFQPLNFQESIEAMDSRPAPSIDAETLARELKVIGNDSTTYAEMGRALLDRYCITPKESLK